MVAVCPMGRKTNCARQRGAILIRPWVARMSGRGIGAYFQRKARGTFRRRFFAVGGLVVLQLPGGTRSMVRAR